MFLITGASGKTGRAILKNLVGKVPVRAFFHSEATLDGVECVAGDLFNPDDLRHAMAGVNTIYHIPPNMCEREVELGRLLIETARSAGVERIVYHSVFHPQIQVMPHHWKKNQVEGLLFESGLAYSILQPTAYMQNLLAYRQRILTEGIYTPPYSPETRISLVDLEDVAEAASSILLTARFNGGTYELVGTPGVSQREVAELISQLIHRPVCVQPVDRQDWDRNARATGMDDYSRTTLIQMFEYYETSGMWGSSAVLESIIGRPPHSLVEFIRGNFR